MRKIDNVASKRAAIEAAHEVARVDWIRAQEIYDEGLSLFRTINTIKVCVAKIEKRGDGKYGVTMPSEYSETSFSDFWTLAEIDELHAWAHDMLDEQPEKP